MNRIEQKYEAIRNPSNLVEGWSIEEFNKWLDIQLEGHDHLTSLIGALKAFEEEELYEYCELIKNKIDSHEKFN